MYGNKLSSAVRFLCGALPREVCPHRNGVFVPGLQLCWSRMKHTVVPKLQLWLPEGLCSLRLFGGKQRKATLSSPVSFQLSSFSMGMTLGTSRAGEPRGAPGSRRQLTTSLGLVRFSNRVQAMFYMPVSLRRGFEVSRGQVPVCGSWARPRLTTLRPSSMSEERSPRRYAGAVTQRRVSGQWGAGTAEKLRTVRHQAALGGTWVW